MDSPRSHKMNVDQINDQLTEVGTKITQLEGEIARLREEIAQLENLFLNAPGTFENSVE